MSPEITIIQTGGTIASEKNEESEKYGLKPVVSEKGIKVIAGFEIELFPLMEKDSSLMTDSDRIAIGVKTAEELSKGRKVGITHGTDTLQDSACFLKYNLVYNSTRVAFTGALYPRRSGRYDGDRNFRDTVIFCGRGNEFSGVFVVLGGYVMDPEFWGKHLYRFHDPVIQKYQQILENGTSQRHRLLKWLTGLKSEFFSEPFDPFAVIIQDKVLKRKHTTPFIEVDGHFTVKRGQEGYVKGLDVRGPTPIEEERKDLYQYLGRTKKMTNTYLFLKHYAQLKECVVNRIGEPSQTIDLTEELIKEYEGEPDRLLKYWKCFDPTFDERCSLKEVHIFGDASSDLSRFVDERGGVAYSGFVMRGWGFGHVNTSDRDTIKFLNACKKEEVPIVVTTAEGVIVSDEYQVARDLIYKFNGIPSGTRSDKEAQIRLASAVSHPKKREFIRKVAEEYGLNYLDIVRAYHVGGSLFKTPQQRLRYEEKFNVPTNLDIAACPLFSFEEKILLLATALQYLRKGVDHELIHIPKLKFKGRS